ncbi:hypothetical protein VB002_06310 [Campylobacter concisus]
MKEYNSLFINNEKKFSYKGFASPKSEAKYMQKINDLRKFYMKNVAINTK